MGRTVIYVVRTCGPTLLLYRLFGNKMFKLKICLNLVLVNRLGGLSLPSKSVVRLTVVGWLFWV